MFWWWHHNPPSWWQNNSPWIVPLLCVAFGFALATGKDMWARRHRKRAHWAALRAEIDYAITLATTYLQDGIMAPLYRLPTVAYSKSLPALLEMGDVAGAQTHSLIQFFTEVETLNRGLDHVHDARSNPEALQVEYGRNLKKARALVQSYFPPAKAAIDAHLRPQPCRFCRWLCSG